MAAEMLGVSTSLAARSAYVILGFFGTQQSHRNCTVKCEDIPLCPFSIGWILLPVLSYVDWLLLGWKFPPLREKNVIDGNPIDQYWPQDTKQVNKPMPVEARRVFVFVRKENETFYNVIAVIFK